MARVCPHSEWFACLWLFIVCIRAWRREAFSRDKPVTARPLHREHHGHFVVACLHPSLTLKPRLQVSAATRGFARPVTVERLPPARIDSTGVGETTVFEHSLSLSLSLSCFLGSHLPTVKIAIDQVSYVHRSILLETLRVVRVLRWSNEIFFFFGIFRFIIWTSLWCKMRVN